MGSCLEGYSDCDSLPSNGCETNLDSGGNCSGASNIGSACGDMGCTLGAEKTGVGEGWYNFTLQECNTAYVGIKLRAELTPPVGADYDLYLYRPCGILINSSTNSGELMDVVAANINDTSGPDTTNFYLEVRYKSGSSCTSWDLKVYGGC
jgi:hypothetical protein